jgi:hypothetical protein
MLTETVPEVFTVAELKLVVAPVGTPERARLTIPENEFFGVTVN